MLRVLVVKSLASYPAFTDGRKNAWFQPFAHARSQPPVSSQLKTHVQSVQSFQNVIASMGIVPLEIKEVAAGRLHCFIRNWERLTKDRWVLDTIRGYNIEFLSTPKQLQKPHVPQFNQDQTLLIMEEVGVLQRKGVVMELPALPVGGFFSTLFLVPKKDGGQRPVINLKALNNFVRAPHFKMEGIHTLKTLLQPVGTIG